MRPRASFLRAVPALPAAARRRLDYLGEPIARLDAEIAGIDARLIAQHNANAVSSLLAEIPGIGKITALSLALRTDPTPIRSGRHVTTWIAWAMMTGGEACRRTLATA